MIIKRFYSTSRWIKQHLNDPYVKRAQKENYRSRAAFKLQQINLKYNIIQSNYQILDLGSAPGSWSQYIKRNTTDSKVVAIDLLPMDTIQGVDFFKGNIEDQKLISKITKQYTSFDLIVSDIAPSTTGNQDHQEEIELNRMCAFTASKLLKNKGSMVMKTFIGPFSKQLVHSLQYFFEEVHKFKPKASRSSSFEQFIICLRLKEERRSKIPKLLLMEYTGRLTKPQIHRLLQ